jgi:hypothetical protein
VTKTKKRRKATAAQPHRPSAAVFWDVGAAGPANRVNLKVEDAAEINPATGKPHNPNNIKRLRRVDMVEIWHRKGIISTEGYNAAVVLRAAFENTLRAPGWPDNDRVQSSPKPDVAVAMQIDRLSAFVGILAYVRPADRPIIDACVLHGGTPASAFRQYRGRRYEVGLRVLSDALDAVAAALSGRPLDGKS